MKRSPKVMGCPVELSLHVLGGKWKPVILAHLKEGPQRYGELRRKIPVLSDKVLSERLADLQAGGLVARDEASGVYSLTMRGESLRPVLQALYDWGQSQSGPLGVKFRDPAP